MGGLDVYIKDVELWLPHSNQPGLQDTDRDLPFRTAVLREVTLRTERFQEAGASGVKDSGRVLGWGSADNPMTFEMCSFLGVSLGVC